MLQNYDTMFGFFPLWLIFSDCSSLAGLGERLQ